MAALSNSNSELLPGSQTFASNECCHYSVRWRWQIPCNPFACQSCLRDRFRQKAANKTYNTKKDKIIKVYGWNVASFCVAPSSKLFGNEEHTFHFLASRRVLQIGCSLPCQQTTRHWEPPTSQSDPGSFWPTGDVQRIKNCGVHQGRTSGFTLWSNCFGKAKPCPNSFRITLDWKRLQRTLWEQHLFLVLSLWVRHKH